MTRVERWLNEKVERPRYWVAAGAIDFYFAGSAHDWFSRVVCLTSGVYILWRGRKVKVSQ